MTEVEWVTEWMDAIRETGESFMIDTILVYRYADDVVDWDDENPAYDYGDDEVDFVEPEHHAEAFIGSFKGWIVSKMDRSITINDGQIQLLHDHIVRVPVGSDIRPRDIIVFADGERKTVFDTNVPDTWDEWMKVVLRGTE